MKILKSLVLFSMISFYAAAQQPATIPSFIFFKLDQSDFSNKDLAKGKKILFVYFDTDCDHCQHAIKEINKHAAEFKNAAVYLVTVSQREKIDRFLTKYAYNLKQRKNFTVLQDIQNLFVQSFMPIRYPAFYLYSSARQLILYDDDENKVSKFLQLVKK